MQQSNNPEYKEGKVAIAIEEQTAKIPQMFFYGQHLAQWHFH